MTYGHAADGTTGGTTGAPSAVSAEREYLAIMLEYAARSGPQEFLKIVEGLDPDDMLRPAHRETFDAVTRLWNDDPSIVEPVAVWHELARRAREIGAAEAFGVSVLDLTNLAGSSATISRAGHFAGLIRDAARRRRGREVTDAISRELAGPARPELLDELHGKLAAVLADGPRTGRLSAVAASGMGMRAAKWLYRQRIPAGAITLLAGREGIGKSTISYDFVDRVTRGELDGRYLGIPRGVAVVASEDAWAEVIIPRLVAARADLDRVFRIDARSESGGTDSIIVPVDLPELGRLCKAHDIALLVLDPVMSVLDSSIDTHKDREVRRALDPLSEFAARSGVAVLGLIHVNKSGTSDPLNSIMGSRAFAAVARSVLYCIADPEAEDGQERYLLGHPKSNLGPKQPSIGYHLIEAKIELDPADVEPGDDAVILTSRVVWDGEDERTVGEIMEGPRVAVPPGDLAVRILAFVRGRADVVRMEELAGEFDDVSADTLRQNLARMVRRGDLVRPSRGCYAANPDAGL